LSHPIGSLVSMNGSQTKQSPLAWSQTGDAIELPESATQWRVRRLNGGAKGGAPELVYGLDGLPLVVDIGINAADFAELVERRPGKYRLDAVDDQRKAVQGVQPAYFVLSGSESAGRGEVSTGTPDMALRTLAEVFVKQSAHVNALIDACTRLVGAVDSAGVSKRPPPPELPPQRNGVEEEEEEDDEPEPREPDWLDRAAEFCSKVPPESLRVIGEVAPEMVAKGIRQVMSEGLAGFVADKVGGRS
jgi:hypothetical protein